MVGTDGITDGAKTAIKGYFEDLSGDATGLMVDILPYALAVLGLKWGVGQAKGFFKKSA